MSMLDIVITALVRVISSVAVALFPRLIETKTPLVLLSSALGSSLERKAYGQPFEQVLAKGYNLNDPFNGGVIGWAGSCKISFSVYNAGKRVIRIDDIMLDKTMISEQSGSCYLLFPAGPEDGDTPLRFLAQLDTDPQSMRLVHSGPNGRYCDDDWNYFESGSIKVRPGDFRDFIVVLSAEKHAYSCSLHLKYSKPGRKRQATLMIDGKQAENQRKPECLPQFARYVDYSSIKVFPLSQIPEDQRYRCSWGLCDDAFVLESRPLFEGENRPAHFL